LHLDGENFDTSTFIHVRVHSVLIRGKNLLSDHARCRRFRSLPLCSFVSFVVKFLGFPHPAFFLFRCKHRYFHDSTQGWPKRGPRVAQGWPKRDPGVTQSQTQSQSQIHSQSQSQTQSQSQQAEGRKLPQNTKRNGFPLRKCDRSLPVSFYYSKYKANKSTEIDAEWRIFKRSFLKSAFLKLAWVFSAPPRLGASAVKIRGTRRM